MTRSFLVGAALALAVLAPGCGGDDEDEGASEPPRPAETVDQVPDLPPRWEVHVNRAGGFAFGLPPGWKADDRRGSTVVRSFDRLVVVQITSDRTTEALETPLDEFATRALAALPGFEHKLEPSEPRKAKHRYEAVAVTATGKAAKSGVPERVRLIVLRRDRLVTFTVVIAANRARPAGASEAVAMALVRTLRSRPVVAAASPEGV